MDFIRFHQRLQERNPLHPYSWQVQYRGGGGLKQFDFDGYHYGREIDKARLASLVILGHPDSPITLPAVYPDRAPDEIILKAQVSMSHTLGTTGFERQVRYLFGLRYGPEKFLLEIDDAGKLWKTNTEEETGGLILPGALLDQIGSNGGR